MKINQIKCITIISHGMTFYLHHDTAYWRICDRDLGWICINQWENGTTCVNKMLALYVQFGKLHDITSHSRQGDVECAKMCTNQYNEKSRCDSVCHLLHNKRNNHCITHRWFCFLCSLTRLDSCLRHTHINSMGIRRCPNATLTDYKSYDLGRQRYRIYGIITLFRC